MTSSFAMASRLLACRLALATARLGHFTVAPAQTADIVVKGQRLHVTARCTDGSR